MNAAWFKFTTKMKWVLLGTIASVVGIAGSELADTFPVSENPWVAIILAALPFISGYIPKEKNTPA